MKEWVFDESIVLILKFRIHLKHVFKGKGIYFTIILLALYREYAFILFWNLVPIFKAFFIRACIFEIFKKVCYDIFEPESTGLINSYVCDTIKFLKNESTLTMGIKVYVF